MVGLEKICFSGKHSKLSKIFLQQDFPAYILLKKNQSQNNKKYVGLYKNIFKKKDILQFF